jgi:hypothetical protein
VLERCRRGFANRILVNDKIKLDFVFWGFRIDIPGRYTPHLPFLLANRSSRRPKERTGRLKIASAERHCAGATLS